MRLVGAVVAGRWCGRGRAPGVSGFPLQFFTGSGRCSPLAGGRQDKDPLARFQGSRKRQTFRIPFERSWQSGCQAFWALMDCVVCIFFLKKHNKDWSPAAWLDIGRAGNRRKSRRKMAGNRCNFRQAEIGFPRSSKGGNRDRERGKLGRIAHVRKSGNREIGG